MSHDAFPHPSRRSFLAFSAATFAAAGIPRIASAAGARDPRLVVIVLRGALDGMSALGPIGDPDYAGLHGDIALRYSGDHAAIKLNDFFGLNPAMVNFARLYGAKQALMVHAVASNYRDRSHFDGQDVLESGMLTPGQTQSGWLNRAIAALPMGDKVDAPNGLAVGTTAPLVIRGPAPILGWAPTSLAKPTEDLIARTLGIYAHVDPAMATALREGFYAEALATQDGMAGAKPGGADVAGMRQAAEGAARLMAADNGPRVAALAFDGWDTHANEGGATGRLAQLLGGLDQAFAAFEKELGPKWNDTVVVAVTEFGRTARINGTVGTDHGTATVAFLAGGAVSGGRVIADWPGLKNENLYEGRDLKPTTDLRAVIKGVLADHLGLPAQVLAQKVFPDTIGVAPMAGLIAS